MQTIQLDLPITGAVSPMWGCNVVNHHRKALKNPSGAMTGLNHDLMISWSSYSEWAWPPSSVLIRYGASLFQSAGAQSGQQRTNTSPKHLYINNLGCWSSSVWTQQKLAQFQKYMNTSNFCVVLEGSLTCNHFQNTLFPQSLSLSSWQVVSMKLTALWAQHHRA